MIDQLNFICACNEGDSIDFHLSDEPDMIYVEVDQASSFLSGAYLDVGQVSTLVERLQEWLRERK